MQVEMWFVSQVEAVETPVETPIGAWEGQMGPVSAAASNSNLGAPGEDEEEDVSERTDAVEQVEMPLEMMWPKTVDSFDGKTNRDRQ